MSLHRSAVGKLALSTFLLTIPFGSAFAQDATAVADRLKEVAAKQGITLGWSNVTGDASSMVIEGATIKLTPEDQALPIGKLTLSGITEDNGAYVVETLSTDPFNTTDGGVTLDVSAVEIGELRLPADGSTDPLDTIMVYQTAELASFSVKMADKTAFEMTGLGMEITPPADGKPMEFGGAVEKFTADLTLIDDPQSKAVVEALGYQTINGFMEMAGSWQPADGQMALSQYDISVDNVGTLGMTFDIGGYTLEFIKSMQDLSKKMAENPGGDNNANNMAMLGLMQQLTIASASIRFDDDSITNKVLDYVGSQQGVSGKDIANQAKAIVPFLTGQLNNPELAAQISAAVNAYLDDPQNIEIAAEPSSPVPVAAIAAGAMSNPMDLTKTLGVKVTANQ